MIKIIKTNQKDKVFINLIAKLDSELWQRYGAEQQEYDELNSELVLDKVFLAMHKDDYTGCGSYQKYKAEVAEIKRVYVQPEYRGRGISKMLIKEIEVAAKDDGYLKCILETGPKQHEAIGLYEKLGYKKIENYGHYKGMDLSICYEKEL